MKEPSMPSSSRRPRRLRVCVAGWCLATLSASAAYAQTPALDTDMFVGTTPAGTSIGSLDLHAARGAEQVRWEVRLRRDSATQAPTTFDLRYAYGPTHSRSVTTVERHGQWTQRKASAPFAEADVYDLAGTVSFLALGRDILHFRAVDGRLMAGNGGWSYTLSRAERAEVVVRGRSTPQQPEVSYPIGPLAAGSAVFGVFEGRTPCQGIARELARDVPAGCFKLKWRVTLFRNPDTGAPTTYLVEGGLFPRTARRGSWTALHGTPAHPWATSYQLASDTERPILLQKGDENVLFFLNRERGLMVGNEEFAYTLDRRAEPRR